MHKKIDLIYSFLHIPFDIVALAAAFILSYQIRGNGLEIYKLPYEEYRQLVYVAIPIWILVFMIEGLYRRQNLFGTLQNMSRIATGVLAGWASFVVYLTFLKIEETQAFPRLMLIYILIFSFIFVFFGRFILRLVQLMMRKLGIGRRRLMLFGEGKDAYAVEYILQHYKDVGINFVKHLAKATENQLDHELKKHNIDELIIDDHQIGDDKILEYIRIAQKNGVVCHLVPNKFEVQASNLSFQTLAGIPLLTFRQTPLEGWGRIVKRGIDIFLSLIGLIVLSPVFLVIALLIKIGDPGPVFYLHTRISRGRKKIRLYKFRTMLYKYCTGEGFSGKSDAEIFSQELGRPELIEEFKKEQKLKDDPRVSKLGRFLRKTNIDEIPQLINVLKGDLSLVGPRPIVQDELEKYGHWSSYLLSIKPGMTGLWQVSGRNDISYDERVQLDTQYVQNWSLWQDFIIMIKTILSMISGEHRGY